MLKKKTLIKFYNYWLPVVLWAVVIFLFSSFPTTQASEIHWQDFIVKKTAHIIEFGILTTLVYRALKENGVTKKLSGYYAIMFSILYGASDEFHQSFTPGREPHIRDVAFDTIGAVLAIYIIWKYLPPNRKSNKLFSIIYEFIYGKNSK